MENVELTITLHDDYLMDMENSALEKWYKPIITGVDRAYNKEWIEHIKQFVDYGVFQHCSLFDDKEATAIAVEQYRKWVIAGYGDIWFLPTK